VHRLGEELKMQVGASAGREVAQSTVEDQGTVEGEEATIAQL